MSSIRLVNGQWLLVGGEVAISDNCCCEPVETEYRCAFCTDTGQFSWTDTGWPFAGGIPSGYKYLDSVTYTLSGYFDTLTARTNNSFNSVLSGVTALTHWSSGWSCMNGTIIVPCAPPGTYLPVNEITLGEVQIKFADKFFWPAENSPPSEDGCLSEAEDSCGGLVEYTRVSISCPPSDEAIFGGFGWSCCGNTVTYDVVALAYCCGNLRFALKCQETGALIVEFPHVRDPITAGGNYWFDDDNSALYLGSRPGGSSRAGRLLTPPNCYSAAIRIGTNANNAGNPLAYSAGQNTGSALTSNELCTTNQWAESTIMIPTDTGDDCLRCGLALPVPSNRTIRIEAEFNWVDVP